MLVGRWDFVSRLKRRITEGILTKCLWTVGWFFLFTSEKTCKYAGFVKCIEDSAEPILP